MKLLREIIPLNEIKMTEFEHINDKVELDKKNALLGKPAHPKYTENNPSKPLPVICPKSHAPMKQKDANRGHQQMVNTMGRLS